jgi:ABC-type antimicrobial peptide transport system permease subunit
MALAIAVLIALAAGALPAWRAARLSPVEALRHD